MPDRLLVYVDGFNLYHGLHDTSRHRLLWLDLVQLARNLRPRSELIGVKYFTAMVLNQPEAQSRQELYLDALRSLHGPSIDIVIGRYTQKQKRCRHCSREWTHYEEKETDVNIAVNLVADAAAQRADSFLVISADSDIAPAVRMARTLNERAFFVAAFPPNRYSAELKSLMPASFHIGASKLNQSLLPESVTTPNGVILTRPPKWS